MNPQQLQQQNEKINKTLSKIKNKFLVMSGKGGVGKSTISVNLAAGLAEKGFKTGLLDVDIHGPDVFKMLNLEGKNVYSDGKYIYPVEYNKNLKVISIAGLLENSQTPVVWRGPLKTGVIKQFLSDVYWDELDYLVIDSPPGTGDEPLTIAQLIKDTGVIIVTTPQDVALLDIRKSINFCRQLNLKIIGIIENMSELICPYCGNRIKLFKSDGGRKLAEEMNIHFLGSLPFDPEIVNSSDDGTPYIISHKDTEISKKLMNIIDKFL